MELRALSAEFSFYLIYFVLIVGQGFPKSELNQPRTNEESLNFTGAGRKTPDNETEENPHNKVGTENLTPLTAMGTELNQRHQR